MIKLFAEALLQKPSMQTLDLKTALATAIPDAEARAKLFCKLGGTKRMKELLEQAMEIEDNPIPIFRRALEESLYSP